MSAYSIASNISDLKESYPQPSKYSANNISFDNETYKGLQTEELQSCSKSTLRGLIANFNKSIKETS